MLGLLKPALQGEKKDHLPTAAYPVTNGDTEVSKYTDEQGEEHGLCRAAAHLAKSD